MPPQKGGLKHVKVIMEKGGMILFLVMRNDAKVFMPNWGTHKEFAEILKKAYDNGVEVKAALLNPMISGNCLRIEFDRYLPVRF